MTDAQFYKSFYFNLYQYRHYYSTDHLKHTGSPQHYLARLIQGTAKIRTASETLHLKAGDVFYIPRGLKYRSHWYPDDDAPVRLYSFGFNYFPSLEHHFYKLQKIECTAEERIYLSELESDITVSPLSIGRLYRLLGEAVSHMQLESAKSDEVTIGKALEFMRQNDHYTVGDVARHCGISESALFVKFRRHLDQTPIEASHRILADKAEELLSTTDLTVEEISSRLGFSSSSYFRKIFRAQTGKTPIEFRKQAQCM